MFGLIGQHGGPRLMCLSHQFDFALAREHRKRRSREIDRLLVVSGLEIRLIRFRQPASQVVQREQRISILGRIAHGFDGPAIRGGCRGVLIEPPQQVGLLKGRGDSLDAVGIALPDTLKLVQRRMSVVH